MYASLLETMNEKRIRWRYHLENDHLKDMEERHAENIELDIGNVSYEDGS
jgi:hypothetical protein